MLINVGIIAGLMATIPLAFPYLSSYFSWTITEYWMYLLPFIAVGSTLFFVHFRSLPKCKQETEKDWTTPKQVSLASSTTPSMTKEEKVPAPVVELLEEAHVFLKQSE